MTRRALNALLLATLLTLAPCGIGAGSLDTGANEQKPRKKARAPAERPYGREGDLRNAKRVIAIEMSDAMRFFPNALSVKRGDTVRFELRNSGQVPHEMVIGTMDELKKRAALMRRNPGANHPEGHTAYLAPGASTRMVWQFTKAGEFYYACLVPGHFDAGMIGTIVVR